MFVVISNFLKVNSATKLSFCNKLALQIIQKSPGNCCPCLYYQVAKFDDLMSSKDIFKDAPSLIY